MPPGRFLSDVEIERLERFPETIEPRVLVEHFRLDEHDLEFVRGQYGAARQLGIAVQLCALRWFGFVPEDLTAAPPEAIARLAEALDVPARAIFDYSVRPQTRRERRPLVRAHAGFRPGGEREPDLRAWAIETALEHDRPSLLLAEILRRAAPPQDRAARGGSSHALGRVGARGHLRAARPTAHHAAAPDPRRAARDGGRWSVAARVAARAADQREPEGITPRA